MCIQDILEDSFKCAEGIAVFTSFDVSFKGIVLSYTKPFNKVDLHQIHL